MGDEWRVRVEFETSSQRNAVVRRLTESRRLEELGTDAHGDYESLLLYAPSKRQAVKIRRALRAEFAKFGFEPTVITIDQWLHDAEEWSGKPSSPVGRDFFDRIIDTILGWP